MRPPCCLNFVSRLNHSCIWPHPSTLFFHFPNVFSRLAWALFASASPAEISDFLPATAQIYRKTQRDRSTSSTSPGYQHLSILSPQPHQVAMIPQTPRRLGQPDQEPQRLDMVQRGFSPFFHGPLQNPKIKIFRVTTIFRILLLLTHSFQITSANLKH